MRPSGLALLAFCLAAIVGALHWLPRQTSEGFLLKVTLIDPAARTEIQTRIETQKPFECMETHKGGKITIRGELSSKRKGSYHLRITIVEWASETSSSTENFEMDLVPGAAVSRSFVSSFVYQRVILLARAPMSSESSPLPGSESPAAGIRVFSL
jgi:hypothetical protein